MYHFVHMYMSDNNFFTDDKFFFVGKRRKQTEKGKNLLKENSILDFFLIL